MTLIIMKNKFSLIIAFMVINGCSLSPGMHMNTKSQWLDESKYVYIDSIGKNVRLTGISETFDISYKNNYQYKEESNIVSNCSSSSKEN